MLYSAQTGRPECTQYPAQSVSSVRAASTFWGTRPCWGEKKFLQGTCSFVCKVAPQECRVCMNFWHAPCMFYAPNSVYMIWMGSKNIHINWQNIVCFFVSKYWASPMYLIQKRNTALRNLLAWNLSFEMFELCLEENKKFFNETGYDFFLNILFL